MDDISTPDGFHVSGRPLAGMKIRFTLKAAVINKGSNLPCSFAAPLRCSLVADRGGYAPRSRLAGRQNPGGILLPLFITAA
jgi:hypothetical protein